MIHITNVEEIDISAELEKENVKNEQRANSRCYCLICNDDYRPHQTIIADDRNRCICLNCWGKIKRNI